MRMKLAAASMMATLAGGTSEPALIAVGMKGEAIPNPESAGLYADDCYAEIHAKPATREV